MKLYKYSGAGNDFVVLDGREGIADEWRQPEQISRLCDRHTGFRAADGRVGADGIMILNPSAELDFSMEFYNPDGTGGMMCGNGGRCIVAFADFLGIQPAETGRYIFEAADGIHSGKVLRRLGDYSIVRLKMSDVHGIVPADRDTVTVDTKSGVKTIDLTKENGKVASATVDMGVARPDSEMPEKITVAGMDLLFYGIDLGNLHAVYFLEDNDVLMSTIEKCGDLLPSLPLEKIGPAFENHPRFPDKVNSEFIDIVSRQEVNFRVWERGSGETLACGTGITASAIAAYVHGLAPAASDSTGNVTYVMRSRMDDLSVDFVPAGPADNVYLTGPAALIR